MNIEVLLILIIAALSCVSVGIFLMLRNLSMMADAMSHTILLGIVLGFFISKSIHSPILLVCGVLIGLLSSFAISLLEKTKRMSEDAAIGIIFPLFFGSAVILITLFASNVHLDLDSVLLGEVTFAPLSRMIFFGVSMPTSLVWLSGGLILNVVCITLFYKELKITSFDPVLATITGISIVAIQYGLMGLVSLTSVLAFDAIGSILVIAFMIGPAMSGRLVSNTLEEMIVASIIFTLVNTVIGYFLSLFFDVSVAGMIATVTGVTFLITVCVAPEKGVITQIIKRQTKKRLFEQELLLLHLQSHEHELDYAIEAGKKTILFHLHWDEKKFAAVSEKLIVNNEIECENDVYFLTEKGSMHVEYVRAFYKIKHIKKEQIG